MRSKELEVAGFLVSLQVEEGAGARDAKLMEAVVVEVVAVQMILYCAVVYLVQTYFYC